jgi:hypothetical protein
LKVTQWKGLPEESQPRRDTNFPFAKTTIENCQARRERYQW